MLRLVLVALLLLVCGACAAPKTDKKDPFFDKWRVRVEESRGYSPAKKTPTPLPPEPAPAPQNPAAPEKSLPTQKITLKMNKVEVAVLLRAMARAVDLNLIVNESVRGRMDLNIRNAPWDQVFSGILRTQGLVHAWEGDIIRVISMEDIGKELKQLETEQQIKSKREEIRQTAPMEIRTVHVKYADAAKLRENLEKFLIPKGEGAIARGAVMVDEHNNALIIYAVHSDIEYILPLIDELDRPTPQILIEAHIVETTRETARELGVQWGGLSNGGDVWIYPGSNSSGVLGQSLSEGAIDPTSGVAASFPAALASGTGMTLGLAIEKAGESLLAVQLSALEESGKLNILSSPSITTLDNQTALIESGKEVPYQTIEDDEIQIEWKKAVLSLEVTPHVIDETMLKMKIKTNKDELDFSQTVEGNPTIITRNAETQVFLFDGQTTVIGGLSQETTSNAESGVPGVKNVPLFGSLFKGSSNSNTMEEVLIFITPHILKEKPTAAVTPDRSTPREVGP